MPAKRMRIIAGQFRGRLLKSPSGSQARPTLSRIRQALFNILQSHLNQARFLELYAGAGSVGLEALSRGSLRVVMIEADHLMGRILMENVQRFDPEHKLTEVILLDAGKALQRLVQRGEQFDIVFLDPPYDQVPAVLGDQLQEIQKVLAFPGIVVLQHSRRQPVPQVWAGCQKIDSRCYGDTMLSFFQVRSCEK